jgi:glycosyltransferase involved in cell wall biosynthesis
MECINVSGMVGKGKQHLSPKIVVAVNSSWNLINYRMTLIKSLVSAGYEVITVAPSDAYFERLGALGCRNLIMSMDANGVNPLRDLSLLWSFLRLFWSERPDLYLGFTAKPNLYGSLIAHFFGVPVINNIAGLGLVFTNVSWLTHLLSLLYRLILPRSAKVFFQNNEDQEMFISKGFVQQKTADCLPGSGVDLTKYATVPLPNNSRIRFLLIARMLWEKGVGEFVEASRLLKKQGIDAECCLLGFIDVKNHNAISQKQIDTWVDEGVISYLGASDEVASEIAKADCIVLPSFYREGTPRSLLEGAAMGRPIITTNSVGCRDVVEHGLNGYLCIPKDPSDLANKMAQIVTRSSDERTAMGVFSREKAEREFDEEIVIKKYLQAVEACLKKPRACSSS